MKLNLSIFTGVASLAALMSGAFADTATTEPVGYVTSEISAVANGAQTFVAPALTNKAEVVAPTTNNPSSSNTLTFAAALPAGITTGQYYAEIKSGSGEGWWSSIATIDGPRTTITTDGNLPAGLAVGAIITIRKHVTIDDFFGATNSAGLSDVANPDGFDSIEILDPVSQETDLYVWVTTASGVATNGWYNFVSNALEGPTAIIYPGASVRVTVAKSGAQNKKLVSVGHVKTNKTQVPIYPNDNWVAPMRATGVTLGDSGLDTGSVTTGLKQEDGTGVGDFLNTLPLNQVAQSYVALTPALAAQVDPLQPNGFFNFVTQAASNSINIPEGTGVVILRQVANGSGIWTVPAPTIAP